MSAVDTGVPKLTVDYAIRWKLPPILDRALAQVAD
jgi:hypothetical protein